jgi:surface protein
MPTLSPTDEKFCGVLRILEEDPNYVALIATGSAGYTVDWGDGSAPENIASNTKAEHSYNYASIPLSATHTVVEGISAKAVLVTVVPQAGGNLTTFSLQARHSRYAGWPASKYPTALWLDVSINGPNLTQIGIGGVDSSTEYVALGLLQNVTIGTVGKISSCYWMFGHCYSLQNVSLFDTSNVSDFQAMFGYCYSLLNVPFFNTGNGTNFTSMFQRCFKLKAIPSFDTSKATTIASMFNQCLALKTIPFLNTPLNTSLNGTFQNCFNLKNLPLLDTAKVTNQIYSNHFCISLLQMPSFNLSAPTTNSANAFRENYVITEIPYFDALKWTNMTNQFYSDYCLARIPLLNTRNVTNFTGIFQNCYCLPAIPILPTGKVTIFTNAFNNCRNIHTLKLNVSAGTTFTTMFNNMWNLRTIELSGLTRGVTLDNTPLEREDIVNFFNSLGTASGTQTISLVGAPGVDDLTPADELIATGKGFTLKLT